MTKATAVFTALLALFVLTAPTALFAHPHPELLESDLMPYPFWTEPEDGDIYHVATGQKFSFGGMMDMLSGSRVIYIGESHNNIHAHRIQAAIIRELAERFPGRVAVGMEMFRTPQQASLDRWTAGELTEIGFLKESGWYDNWSMSYGYYREILDLAREKKLDLIALNPPIELQRHVGMTSRDKLPEELAAQLPDMDSSDPYQQASIKAIYGSHEGGGEGMAKAFLRVQILWEETMAEQIVDYLDSTRGRGKIVVALTGGAHVKYGFGVPKKVLRRKPLPYSIVLPAPISYPEVPEDSEEQIFMEVELPEVPLQTADFLWAVPYEILEEDRVKIGIMLNFSEGEAAIEKVMEDSAGERAGLQAGDVLLTLDDMPIGGMGDVVIVLREKKTGDSVRIGILRGDEPMTVEATFTKPADQPG